MSQFNDSASKQFVEAALLVADASQSVALSISTLCVYLNISRRTLELATRPIIGKSPLLFFTDRRLCRTDSLNSVVLRFDTGEYLGRYRQKRSNKDQNNLLELLKYSKLRCPTDYSISASTCCMYRILSRASCSTPGA